VPRSKVPNERAKQNLQQERLVHRRQQREQRRQQKQPAGRDQIHFAASAQVGHRRKRGRQEDTACTIAKRIGRRLRRDMNAATALGSSREGPLPPLVRKARSK
jgi:hypothetical protein